MTATRSSSGGVPRCRPSATEIADKAILYVTARTRHLQAKKLRAAAIRASLETVHAYDGIRRLPSAYNTETGKRRQAAHRLYIRCAHQAGAALRNLIKAVNQHQEPTP